MPQANESDPAIAVLLDRIDELTARVDSLAHSLADQQAVPGAPPAAPGPEGDASSAGVRLSEVTDGSPGGDGAAHDPRVTRRRLLLGTATVAAAGAVGVAAAASPAAAANGGTMVLGVYSNAASQPTLLTYSNPAYIKGAFGFASIDQSAPGGVFDGTPAIAGYANRKNFFTAVQGVATGSAVGVSGSSGSASGVEGTSGIGPGVKGHSASGYGVAGNSDSGVGMVGVSQSGIAVAALSLGATAFQCASPRTHINLVPRNNPGAPSADAWDHLAGDLVEDVDRNLWLCTADGHPGTWRKLAGPTSAGAFHALAAPVRIYDSRPGTTPSNGPKSPLAPDVARTLDLKANSSGVPAGATVAAVNLLVLNAPVGAAHLTLWAAGVSQPSGNSMVWGGSAGRFSSLALTALDGIAQCQVSCSGPTDIAVDVVGYHL